MTLRVLQCIFVDSIPTYNHWFETVKNFEDTTCTFSVCGFVSDNYIEKVREILEDYETVDETTFYEKNVGKSHVVNSYVRHHNPNELVLVLDSDIILECSGSEIRELFQVKDDRFAALFLNQEGDVRHKVQMLDDYTTVAERIVWYSEKIGVCMNSIGGGAMVTKVGTLVNHPFEDVGTYGPEDILFIKSLCTSGKRVGVVIDLYVMHPPR